MKKIIQKYSLGKSLKTTLMAVLVLCTCQSYAGDYYLFNTEEHDPLLSIGHHYDDDTCEAEWDHVNKGHDASCGNCDGSIIVDANYSVTGKFKVRYTYNGQTYEGGPFTHSGDITIPHLCAGTYTDIKIISVYGGCSDKWPHDITLGEAGCCHEEGGHIRIAGSGGATETTICVDGIPDPFDVDVSGSSGTNFRWVITDDNLNILAMPPAPPFDLDGAGLGTCLIWYAAFDHVEGLAVGSNAGHLTGCFDLSNPITVDRRAAEWDHVNKGHDASCGNCDGSIIVDANFNLTGRFRVEYTLNGQTFEEGPFMSPNDITIDHLCAGTYRDITIIGVDTGCENVWPHDITLGEEGCCDEEGGQIRIAGSGGSDVIDICVDGIPDPFDVDVSGSSGTNFAWVITDDNLNILALPPAPPFDLDGAGLGTCLVWYLAFDHVEGAAVGSNAADLSGCFDLSNSITVNRISCCDEEGGSIVIAGSGGSDAIDICVDGVPDPFDVQVMGESATNSAWVITDDNLNILALPPAPPFDLDGAGEGVCLVWYLAYENVQGAMVGQNAADLTGCFDLSNPITVTRTCCDDNGNPISCESACNEEGGTISIPPLGGSGTGTDAIDICVDGVPDPFDVQVMGESATNSAWVITDDNLNILALPPAPPFDLDGAGEGVCLVWYLAYENIQGAMVGENAADLTGCFDLSNPITVTRTCCDDNGNPAQCESECQENKLDFTDAHTDWHENSTSGSYDVGTQTFDIDIADDDHILQNTNESNSGITVGIDPHDRHDEVVITYELSEVASKVVFDIVDLDYKTGGSRQQEKVCVYGLLGNDDTQIMPTIESLDGSVAISGNCATATTNSAVSGDDESILVTFNECVDQIVIVYGSGPDAPNNPDFSKIRIGGDLGFCADTCPGACTAPQSCQDYTLDFDEQGVRWHDNATSDDYDLGGQNVSININNDDHILENTNEDDSGLQIGIDPHDRHDEVLITYTLSDVSDNVVFDIVDLDYKTGGSRQQEKVCVYGLLGDDDTQIMPTIESLDGSVAINGNCATATTNSAVSGDDESVLVTFDECIDQVVIVYGSGPDAPHNPSFSKITIGEDLGFTTEVCPDACEAGGSSREEQSIADINIFPNPTNSSSLVTLDIETNITGRAHIVVMDKLGRSVIQLPIELTNTKDQYQLNTNGLSSGLYFVTLMTQEGQSQAQRLVILGE